jgi:formate dehydrogenase subunit beta
MIVGRVIEVQESDPVGALRVFLKALLDNRIVDTILAPADMTTESGPRAQVVSGAEALATINPLLPLMAENAAMALASRMAQEPRATFGAVLRPCEVCALVEMAKRGEVDLDRVVVIGPDCLATYDEAFYRSASASHPDDPYWLINGSLRFARMGEAAPYRCRTACQMCHHPAADHSAVDVLLGVVGVDVFQKILVLAEETDDARLKLHKMTDRQATEREMAEREVALWRLSERRSKSAAQKLSGLGLAEADAEAITGLLEPCTLCGACLDACPVSDQEVREALAEGRDSFFEAIVAHNRRLASCDGCGMCERHCPEGLPLAAIHRALSQRIQAQLNYVPGRNIDERLPWMT